MALEAHYDYIVAGGGLSGCVVASRLKEYRPDAKILLIEAGQDTRSRTDILKPEVLNLGGELDWMFPCEPSPGVNARPMVLNAGKGLGGGTLINSGGWLRGSSIEYDEWAARVGDKRWSYAGLLPWMKRTESWYEDSPAHHGKDGAIAVAHTVKSANRTYPLTGPVASAWDELGVPALEDFDQNSGSNLGRAQLCEARADGLREHAAIKYQLDGVEILVDTLVKKVVIEKVGGNPRAVGVELADGRVVKGGETIVCTGAIKSPQLLMLSGIGPAQVLREHGIEPVVDNPEVGQNLHDHASVYQFWKLKDPERGLTLGSPNPLFQSPEYTKGVPADWIVSTDVPHDGLAEALEKDEGASPDPAAHPLLRQGRSHVETCLLYLKLPMPGTAPDYAHLTTLLVGFLPTSRGSVSLRSADPAAAPRISMNYLATEVDRYIFRSGLRQLTRLMLDTEFGREYVEGESMVLPLPGVEPAQLDDSDEKLDARLRTTAVTTWHVCGTCSMGTIVDSECRVKGVDGLRVVDASIIPVPLSAHIQAGVYALAELAAAIIAGKV
ncbi:alcohol oxidase [Cryphonectria parasitica EP155]|uniref:Alcohol oxidase n=1 Tax=Cryphonectria parasitica (strain ATCC 38755 / EP155) TaxID=660469 RepID=A0A9P4Y4B9_CRYP1|nr:alcohol oxidase [Cryphonectria parasitica EP155]KAF3766240.1 alcohol oxidase [Cryphonectria parasitica EP155]